MCAAKRDGSFFSFCFFFNDTATTEIYTLSLHDALPISMRSYARCRLHTRDPPADPISRARSEEHTSELQSRGHLVCRLLLEKKKKEKSRLRCWSYRANAHLSISPVTVA